ncbi:hypothetical protein TNIN_360421 [Trichonephila inaurata madagascariensis]|uniref:Uncharacterized protein n=1 Tax=Trichonephila inaurata madagascariensis TaxID=2747483 RepID=A0A8X6MA78_9ARAC|nr:hypothetical protein TNIN_360421 [Trichonephila inaurata madagascariensis]
MRVETLLTQVETPRQAETSQQFCCSYTFTECYNPEKQIVNYFQQDLQELSKFLRNTDSLESSSHFSSSAMTSCKIHNSIKNQSFPNFQGRGQLPESSAYWLRS